MFEDRLRKSDWLVKSVSIRTAYRLVKNYHYAQSATKTGVYTHGLFRVGDEFPESKCLGVAWWLPPTKAAAMATYPEGDWRKVLSLTRLVVAPNIPKNACSFMLMQSVKLIDNSTWECLVTYADTWQNHSGTIYKATNWEYLGLTKPSPVFQDEDGRMMGKKRGARNLTTRNAAPNQQLFRNSFNYVEGFLMFDESIVISLMGDCRFAALKIIWVRSIIDNVVLMRKRFDREEATTTSGIDREKTSPDNRCQQNQKITVTKHSVPSMNTNPHL